MVNSPQTRFRLSPIIWQGLRFATCPIVAFLFLMIAIRFVNNTSDYCDDIDILMDFIFHLFALLIVSFSTFEGKPTKRAIDRTIIALIVLYLMELIVVFLSITDDIASMETLFTALFLLPLLLIFFIILSFPFYAAVYMVYYMVSLLFVYPLYSIYISQKSSDDIVALPMVSKLDRAAQWISILLLLAIISMLFLLHIEAPKGEMWHSNCWGP